MFLFFIHRLWLSETFKLLEGMCCSINSSRFLIEFYALFNTKVIQDLRLLSIHLQCDKVAFEWRTTWVCPLNTTIYSNSSSLAIRALVKLAFCINIQMEYFVQILHQPLEWTFEKNEWFVWAHSIWTNHIIQSPWKQIFWLFLLFLFSFTNQMAEIIASIYSAGIQAAKKGSSILSLENHNWNET